MSPLQRGHGPFDEHERPGQCAVTFVMANFKVGGPWAYAPWEVYVSEEEEAHQRRVRGERRAKNRVELNSSGTLEGVPDDQEFRRARVDDLIAGLPYGSICVLMCYYQCKYWFVRR